MSGRTNDDAESPMNDIDIQEMERLLNDLAMSERASAPFGLESRLVAAVVPVAQRGAPARAVLPMVAPVKRAAWSPLRAAAAVALVGTVLTAMMASRPSAVAEHPSVMALEAERDVESILAISAAFEDTAAVELSSLSSDTTTLGERIRQGWSGADWLGEGAM